MRLIVLALFCCVMLPKAHASGGIQEYTTVNGWRVLFNLEKKICSAGSPRDRNGNIIMMFDGAEDKYWRIGVTNRRWYLTKGSILNVAVSIDGVPIPSHNALAYDENTILLIMEKGSRRSSNFIRRLLRGRTMVLNGGSRLRARVSLSGTSTAMQSTRSCIRYVSGSGRSTRTPSTGGSQGPGFTEIPRVTILEIVANLMAKQGVSNYRVLPRDEQWKNSVSILLSSGTLEVYFGAYGNTKSADDYIDYLGLARRRACDGQFTFSVNKVPTSNGDVRRVANFVCRGTKTERFTVSVYRKSNGLFVGVMQRRADRDPVNTLPPQLRGNSRDGSEIRYN